MADEKSTVLGIRLDTEERKRFDEFVGEEGKNNKDFLSTLLNLYELNKGKIKNINLVGDIETLEGYTNKIQQSFINVIDRLESQKDDITEHSQKDLQIYKEKVNTLQNEIELIKSSNSETNEKLTSVNNVMLILKEKNEQFQEIQESNKALIEEYKGKNDMLLGQMKQYQKYHEELEIKKEELLAAMSEKNNLNNLIKDKDATISDLKKDIIYKEKISKELIDEIEKNHRNEISRLEMQSELTNKIAIAACREELNTKLREEQQTYNKEIKEYQTSYKKLLEEIEKIRITPKITKQTKQIKQNKEQDTFLK